MKKNTLIIILGVLVVVSALPARQRQNPQQYYMGIPLIPNLEDGKRPSWLERRKQAEEWMENQANIRQQHIQLLQNLSNQMNADGQIDVEDFQIFMKYSIESQKRLISDMDILYTNTELLKAHIGDVAIQIANQ